MIINFGIDTWCKYVVQRQAQNTLHELYSISLANSTTGAFIPASILDMMYTVFR